MVIFMAILGFFISLYYLHTGFYYDDYYQQLAVSKKPEVRAFDQDKLIYSDVNGLYAIIDNNPERTRFLKDKGLVPWWTPDYTRVFFWRPLASLSLLIDYTCWPDHPWLMHMHNSILFFLLLLILGMVFRRIFPARYFAPLAALVFIVSGIMVMPVAWLANRHSLLAVGLGLTAFLFLDFYYHTKKIQFLCISSFFFLLTLLASEMGVAFLAFLFGYTLFLAKGSLKRKIISLLPFILILITWRIVYNGIGAGVIGSSSYIDPLASPDKFIAAFFLRIPFSLSRLFLSIPANAGSYLSEPALLVVVIILYLILAGLALFFSRYAKGCKYCYFWLSVILFSLVPLSASSPTDRQLIYPLIGMAGFIIQLLHLFMIRKDKIIYRKIISIIIFCIILGVNGVTGVIQIFTGPFTMAALTRFIDKFMDFGDDPGLSGQQLVIVYPPAIHFLYSLSIKRLFDDLPLPRSIGVLSAGIVPSTVIRTSKNRLLIKPDEGFYPPPEPLPILKNTPGYYIGLAYSLMRLERISVDTLYHPRIGEIITLPGITGEVTQLTDDNRIKAIEFTFTNHIDSGTYRFVYWDWSQQKYRPFRFPEVGEEIRFTSKGSPVYP